ncbi:diaminopimelate decarboxylase [Robiginitomaculum antarcticum]|uniref:diaminopimelate decarboxylase n=1 Tax=Robiginitomaculum antarcticum TaxID=437507 RepID=UPI000382EDAD|nr:diaminopimelate decarboxylase [Robiginitomaculum antarcticum]
MRYFLQKNGALHCEDVALSDIAEAVGTPVYVYSAATLARHYDVFAKGFDGTDALIAYSVKANSNLAVLTLLAKRGAGADVVSGGELTRALRAGISPNKIVFSGVGKTGDEMRLALSAGIYQFNVESAAELEALSNIAAQMKVNASIAFRVNPDVAAGGHEKISTGKKENKFGIAWDDARVLYARAAKLPGIRVQGVDVHIGSQITQLEPYERTIEKIGGLIADLRQDGHAIETFDLGGGLGIPYGDGTADPPLPSAYAKMVRRATDALDVRLIFEPGRVIAGNAGALLSRVIYTKPGETRNFLIVDAAMNDLIRPALYGAYHGVEAVSPKPGDTVSYDIVGPVCESGDTFAVQRNMPQMSAGDLVVFHSAGAYGAVQANQYNTRPLVPEVLVSGGEFAIIRKRPDYEQILSTETVPDFIKNR